MLFIKTFKGYEDRTHELDSLVNNWLKQAQVEVVDIKTAMSHEVGGRANSGDLIYTLLYRADKPVESEHVI